ncbi:MAG: type II toxin-antitoxin system VapB family antitoxin [Pseudomonadota bacterium]
MSDPNSNDSARVFMSGKSQAVRLPKKYRFPADCDMVSIRRVGDALILTPRYETWDSLLAAMGPADDGFETATLGARQEELPDDQPRAHFDE